MGLYTKIIDLQKLKQAWEKVRQKKSAPGIDGITVEMLSSEIQSALRQLNIELKEQRYEPMPVRMIMLRKGEKEREVGLFCLRDKIVQQSIACELHKLYDDGFARESYAFHSSRSALEAVAEVEKTVSQRPQYWILKTDIRHFFDEISHEKILQILGTKIKEDEVLHLIDQFLKVQMLDENGELRNKERGIYQGSSIAPLLSNIYLNEFDHHMRQKVDNYYRYADDILCIDCDQNKIEKAVGEIRQLLGALELEVNEEKTRICQVNEEFEYLGYRFCADGKKIPAKKEAALKERLEELWMQNLDFDQKVEKGLEIINGWLQYFSGKRKIESIYELVLEICREMGDCAGKEFCVERGDRGKKADFSEKENDTYGRMLSPDLIDRLLQIRKQFINLHPDICHFFVKLWQAFDRREAVLMEYEQLWQVDMLDVNRCREMNGEAMQKLINGYRNLFISESKEELENMMQLYADLRCYNRASIFDRRLKEMERSHTLYMSASSIELEGAMLRGEQTELQKGQTELQEEHKLSQSSEINYFLNESELELYYQLFAGREDIYARESINAYGKRAYEPVNTPLTLETLELEMGLQKTGQQKMEQQMSLATYVQRNNATAHFMVLDLDISKKILLKYAPGTNEFLKYLNLAKERAYLLRKVLLRLGLSSLLEFSGFRGYHIWIFFQEWISVRYIHMLQDVIMDKLKQEESVQQENILIEMFPNRTRVTSEKPGQCIRFPFSRHMRTGKRTCFLDDTGKAYENQSEALNEAVQYPLSFIKRIIAVNGNAVNGNLVGERNLTNIGQSGQNGKKEELYPDLKPAVKIVLEQCSLMEYLCRKAKMTGYLTHFERQTIVYVFGHLGDDGKAFVHQVMENTLNYRFSVTERFIQKLPEKPISCVKIREQYKQITAEIGCSCRFKRTKSCYPSPVLHAVKDNEEIQQDITLPLSRDISRTKEKQIYEEINSHKKAQELAGKLLEFKKQRRGIDRNIRKLEDELTEIFNNASVDCMEIEMGLLCRRRKDDRYEWMIEL